MPIATTILTNDIFTRTPLYIGGVLDVSAYTELTIDIALTLCINEVTVGIYKINPNSVVETIREFVYTQNQKISLDVGHFDLIDGTTPNCCQSAFGNKIQVTISANHMTSGVITIKGKGRV
jgi:hypothetical protein